MVGESKGEAQQPRFVLVGKFLTMKNMNFQAMQNVVAAIWRPKEGIEVYDLGESLFICLSSCV